MSDVLSIKTTTVKYRPKPQAAVQYEIALLSGALVYNPNDNTGRVKGALQWQVYKIEGDKRTRMPNNVEGMKCYCGYSDNPSSESPSSEAGTNTTDNVTFNDNGKAEVDYNSRTTKQFTIVYGSVTDGVFTQLARLGVPVNVAGKDSTPTLSIHLDNQYDAILCYYKGDSAVIYGSKPVTNIKVMYGGDDITTKLESNVTATANSASFKGEWLTQNEQYRVNSIRATTVVTFSVTYKGQTATAAMTVRLQDGGNKYNIRLSTSTIAHNVSTGAMTDDEVEVEVWMENETGLSHLTSIPQGLKLAYSVDNTSEVDISETYKGTYTLAVGSEARKIVFTLSHEQEGVLDTQSVSVVEVENGKNGKGSSSIDFDNNNATILYNSIKGTYVTGSYPVSNISVVEDGKDISHTAKIYVEVHGLLAQIKGRGYDISPADGAIVPLTTVNGEGIISVTVKGVESTGYVRASYIDSAGVAHTTRFNVSRSVGRYAVEIITTPTQISYNQTTGIASSSTITATLNVIDIYGNRTPNASFSSLGAMYWRYVGDSDWTEYKPNSTLGQSATKLKITNPDFTKNGIEFAFSDGNGNQLDYETVPFSSVTNGGDAFLVNAASMNIALTLSEISYGTPLGDVPNVIYMTKNNVVVVTGMKYKVPGYNGTIDASHTSVEAKYNGWVFVYTFSSASGKLNTKLKKVEQNSPTSVQLPIEVNDSTDNITRTIYVSYTAIQKGPAGRSYKPNTPELYDPKKEYVWNDERRDFIYYAFNVNEKGEQDDEKGVLSYFQYGVKKYDNNGSVSKPPERKGGDDNWELVSEYKSIIVNCLFGTNAVLGGMVFTAQTQTSEGKADDGTPKIVIDGKNGKITANDATIRGEVNATAGVFKNVKITNNCWIEPETEDGDGWFMRGGNDRVAAWWLGYSGKLTGQFTMNTVYDNGSNHPPTASLSFRTPNIQGGTSDGVTLISAYSNINTPLANFSHAKGMMLRICPSEGVGINFINNAGLATPMAFNGAGHGCLNGVIQGYQLNVITSGQIDISKGNTVYCNGNGTNLILPTRENCSNVLGTTGAFALDLTIIGAKGARDFRIYGKYHYPTTTDCYLLNNDHGDNWYATMSQGDVLTLKLIYTGSAFYAYIVSSMQ